MFLRHQMTPTQVISLVKWTAVVRYLNRNRQQVEVIFADWSLQGALTIACRYIRRQHTAGNLNGYRILYKSSYEVEKIMKESEIRQAEIEGECESMEHTKDKQTILRSAGRLLTLIGLKSQAESSESQGDGPKPRGRPRLRR